jgi:hypothetical protein
VFQHTAEFFIEQGIGNVHTKETASLSAEEADGHSIVVAVFGIERHELPAFYRREPEFRFVHVEPFDIETNQSLGIRAIMCGASDEQHYIDAVFGGDQALYQQRLAEVGSVWS